MHLQFVTIGQNLNWLHGRLSLAQKKNTKRIYDNRFSSSNYYGYKSAHNFDPVHICCDFHKNLCHCGSCSVETVADLNSSFNEIAITESPAVFSPSTLDEQNFKLLHVDLIAHRLSLDPGRCCIGSTSFTSGFSLELVNLVCSKFHELNTLADTYEKLPIFSTDNANAVFTILQKYK